MMPEIKCDYGHAMSVSTDEWIKQLSIDQMRYAREQMDALIKKADEAPKRYVWRVCSGDGWVDGNYREEDYEKAADHMLRIYKEKFVREAADFLKEPYGVMRGGQSLPCISVERVSQVEYDSEWFPAETP